MPRPSKSRSIEEYSPSTFIKLPERRASWEYIPENKPRRCEAPKRHSWPVFLPCQAYGPDQSPKAVHERRRLSLHSHITDLCSTLTNQCDEIYERLEEMDTRASQDAAETLMSFTQLCATIRLELITLRGHAERFQIPRLSSFWVQCWKNIYAVRQSLKDIREVLLDLEADYQDRLVDTREDNWKEGNGYHSLDRLDPWAAGFLVQRAERIRDKYASVFRGLREVNLFATEGCPLLSHPLKLRRL